MTDPYAGPTSKPARVPWEQYFMDIASGVATRSTCPKRHVGAVLVHERMILSTGYNGSMRGSAHCADVGCLLDAQGKCIRTVHAEANALLQAAKNGVCINRATCYVTRAPCWSCYKMLANAGVTRVIYLDGPGPHDELELVGGTGWQVHASGMTLHRLADVLHRCGVHPDLPSAELGGQGDEP